MKLDHDFMYLVIIFQYLSS